MPNGLEDCLDLPVWLERGQVYCLELERVMIFITDQPPAGGNLAASWAVLQVMGQEGYIDVARKLMDVTQQMKDGIATIEV